MTTMNVTQFKSHCLGILDKMRDTPEEVVLTKRGQVIAKVVPACDAGDAPWDQLHGTAHFRVEDILAEEAVWEEV